ncbi:M50 family metallopeptidase [Ornithinibacillus xuwenensis]|uniref:M50 family metallopeptidase n=1 Tax=Ornithinibacillus xuwenensis TaxID=3144668 RepID=A0ABU9XC78_9BACI
MKIHKLLPKIHIHPIVFAFLLISVVTGMFVEMLIILSIVLIHEFGHYAAATYFRWRIRKVMLWIFGGVMETDEHGNRPLYEDIVVTLAGPFQHLLIYGFVFIISFFSIIPASIIDLILLYNTTILLFNLLPIYPLDGGKLLFFLLSARLPYQRAYYNILLISMVLCSLIAIIQIVFYPFTLSALLIMIFLFIENHAAWKKRYYVFLRFLINRYKGNGTLKLMRPITVPYQDSLMDVFSRFRRDYKHPIYIEVQDDKRLFIDEFDCLRCYFHEKQYDKSVGEIAKYIAT